MQYCEEMPQSEQFYHYCSVEANSPLKVLFCWLLSKEAMFYVIQGQ